MAIAQEDDSVGPRSQVRLVGYDDAGDPTPRGASKQAHDGLAVHGVQSAGGLVGEQQSAVADDRPCDRNPLALAT